MGRKNVHQHKAGTAKRLGRQPSLEGSENSEPPVHRPKESRGHHRTARGGGGDSSHDTFMKSRFEFYDFCGIRCDEERNFWDETKLREMPDAVFYFRFTFTAVVVGLVSFVAYYGYLGYLETRIYTPLAEPRVSINVYVTVSDRLLSDRHCY